MAFWLGSVYRFTGDAGIVVLKFLNDSGDDYTCEVRGGTMLGTDMVGEIKEISKNSKLLKQYQWTRLADEDVVVAPNDPVVQERRKKRTKDEIEVDNLIEHVQSGIKLNQLWEQINEALDDGNHALFIRLSKEYAKLKKKVTT
jgi:hypothetical protein